MEARCRIPWPLSCLRLPSPVLNARSMLVSSPLAPLGSCRVPSCGAPQNKKTGVNVGIPVPREPFAFGGLSGTLSKYGDFDVTAEGAMEFFTNRRKVRESFL